MSNIPGGFTNNAVPEIDPVGIPQDYETTNVQFLDVREPMEWAEARMPGSVLIPLGELPSRTAELDPAKPVIAICRSGVRSIDAALILRAAGFTDVTSLRGGLIAWSRAGRPLVR